MGIAWKVRETIADVRTSEVLVQLRAHESGWEVLIRDRRQVGSEPLAKASGSSSSHSKAKKSAEETANVLLIGLGKGTLEDLEL